MTEQRDSLEGPEDFALCSTIWHIRPEGTLNMYPIYTFGDAGQLLNLHKMTPK